VSIFFLTAEDLHGKTMKGAGGHFG